MTPVHRNSDGGTQGTSNLSRSMSFHSVDVRTAPTRAGMCPRPHRVAVEKKLEPGTPDVKVGLTFLSVTMCESLLVFTPTPLFHGNVVSAGRTLAGVGGPGSEPRCS